MPTEYHPSFFSEYFGELEGFINTQQCDVNILVGGFNVDFDQGGTLAKLLLDFMSDLNLLACDLSFRSSVKYTYL